MKKKPIHFYKPGTTGIIPHDKQWTLCSNLASRSQIVYIDRRKEVTCYHCKRMLKAKKPGPAAQMAKRLLSYVRRCQAKRKSAE